MKCKPQPVSTCSMCCRNVYTLQMRQFCFTFFALSFTISTTFRVFACSFQRRNFSKRIQLRVWFVCFHLQQCCAECVRVIDDDGDPQNRFKKHKEKSTENKNYDYYYYCLLHSLSHGPHTVYMCNNSSNFIVNCVW